MGIFMARDGQTPSQFPSGDGATAALGQLEEDLVRIGHLARDMDELEAAHYISCAREIIRTKLVNSAEN